MPAFDSDLRHVFYVSRSLARPEDVERILEGARRQNIARGVTGMLLSTGGHFAQLLEGEEEALQDAMRVIGADRRHEAMKVLLEGAWPHRRYASWSMAFMAQPSADDLIAQLISQSAAQPVSPERAERLLKLMFAPPQA